MKKQLPYLLLILFAIVVQACSSPKHFHDEVSKKRQNELNSARYGNVLADVMTNIGSLFFAVATETEIAYIPSEQQFKKLNLINPSNDTIYVNMLTDILWDKNDYCDFMDIRIPPNTNCKVLVPVFADYNLYFSNTPQNDEDELLQINTSNLKHISLYPGLTNLSSTSKN